MVQARPLPPGQPGLQAPVYCAGRGMALEPQPRPCLAGSGSRALGTACPRLWQWPAGWGPQASSPRFSFHPVWASDVRFGAGHAPTCHDSSGLSALSAAPPWGLPEAVVGHLTAPNSTARCLQVSRDPWAPVGPKRCRRRPTSSPCSKCCSSHLHWPPVAALRPKEGPPMPGKQSQAATKSQQSLTCPRTSLAQLC